MGDVERTRYGREHGTPIESPHQAFQLRMKDPWFAWLRPVSELIVQAHERLAENRPITPDEAEAYAAQSMSLLQQDAGGADFRREYNRSLQEQPDIVVAHSAVIKLASAKKSIEPVAGGCGTPRPLTSRTRHSRPRRATPTGNCFTAD